MNSKLKLYWKSLIISFFGLALVVVFTPVSFVQGWVRYIHIGLSFLLIANIGCLILVALFGLYIHRLDLGKVKVLLGLLVILLTNAAGSFALYFYLSRVHTNYGKA